MDDPDRKNQQLEVSGAHDLVFQRYSHESVVVVFDTTRDITFHLY